MSTKRQAALVSVGVVSLITIAKFLFFWLSGSAAVLSEAWHGFSDFLTSLLVLFFVYRSDTRRKVPETVLTRRSFIKMLWQSDPEHKGALVISAILLGVSVSIFLNILLYAKTIVIAFPLVTGFSFILLSIASYFLYSFQRSLGKSVHSKAIIADSTHSHADMLISLATAVSLFLYHFGINIDRYIGLTTALFILLISLNLMINTMREIRGYTTHISLSSAIISGTKFLFGMVLRFPSAQPIVLGVMRRKKQLLVILMIGLLAAYAATCIYTVDTKSSAILLRIGKIVNKDKPLMPGIHFKLPWPFDRVVSYTSEIVYSVQIANTATPDAALIWSVEHGDNQYYISGDNNFFMPYLTVYYKIRDVYTYHTFNKRPYRLLKQITKARVTRLFAATSFYDIAIFRRKTWVEQIKQQIQHDLDSLNAGITIVELLVKDVHPPLSVSGSYEKVVAAKQKQKQSKNDAQKYAFIHTASSKGKAYTIQTEAETTAFETVNKAEGDTADYLGKYSAYKKHPAIIRKTLFLQSAKQTLTQGKKIVFDPKTGLTRKDLYNEQFLFKGGKKR